MKNKKLKILVISNLYPPHSLGGYEHRCKQSVDALRERGHDVHVLTSNHEIEGVTATNEPNVYRLLQIHGFFGHPWLPIHKLFFLELKNNEIVNKTLSKLQPDVVHVWNMGGISKSILLNLEKGPIPIVYDISDQWIARSLKGDVWLSWWNDPGSNCRHLIRKLLTVTGVRRIIEKFVPTKSYRNLRFKNIYFCSAFLRQLTSDAGYDVGHGKIVYCGVEAKKFRVKSKFFQPSRLLWVGRICPDKDPIVALRGLSLTNNKSLNLDFYGKGDDEYLKSLKEEIRLLDLENQASFRQASHDEMNYIYSNYDVLVFTSNWGEPFALTPLEAMSARLPVIMCPDGGEKELGRNEENCILFEIGNPESLAKAILRFCERPDFGSKLADVAYREVHEKYDLPVMIDGIEAILQKAVRKI